MYPADPEDSDNHICAQTQTYTLVLWGAVGSVGVHYTVRDTPQPPAASFPITNAGYALCDIRVQSDVYMTKRRWREERN